MRKLLALVVISIILIGLVQIPGIASARTGAFDSRSTKYTVNTQAEVNALPKEIDASGYDIAVLVEGSGLVLDGFRIHDAAEFGIAVDGQTGVTISNCEVYNINTLGHECGVCVYQGSENSVTNNKVYQCSMGIRLYSSSNNVISSNDISDIQVGVYRNGIYLDSSCNGNTVADNTINNVGTGINLSNFSNENTITENVVSHTGAGIQATASCQNNLIQLNTATFASYAGVYVGYDSNNNKVLDNDVSDCSNGIWVGWDACSNQIIGNTVFNNQLVGISLYDHSSDNTVENNIVSDNTNAGIIVSIECLNNFISNNLVTNSYSGIDLSGASDANSIIKNIISECVHGVSVTGCVSSNIIDNISHDNSNGIAVVWSSDKSLIQHNTVKNNQYGVFVYNSNENTVVDNDATTNIWGISLVSSCKNIVSGNTICNTISDNIGACIQIYSESNFNTIANNLIIGNNAGSGITLDSTSHNEILKNSLSSNKYGILASYSSDCIISENTVMYTSDIGIGVAYSTGCTITYNKVDNVRGGFSIGFEIAQSSDCFALNNVVSNCWNGFRVSYSSSNNMISSNTINDVDLGIALLFGSSSNSVRENTICDCIAGIYLEDACNSNIIADNIATENNVGIRIATSCEDNLVKKNIINDNNEYGIYLTSSNDNSIVENIISENSIHGVYLSSSSNSFISKNTIFNNGDRGIILQDSSNNNMIEDNTAFFNYVGIGVYNSENNVVQYNDASNNFGGINIMRESNCMVRGNTIKESGDNGIYFGTVTNSLIENNLIEYPTGVIQSGIVLDPSVNCKVLNNMIVNCIYGIRLDGGSSTNNLISNNIIHDSNGYGIILTFGSSSNIVNENTVYKTAYGIAIGGSSNNNAITENAVFQNAVGIILTDSIGNTIASNKVYENINSGIWLNHETGLSKNNLITDNTISTNTVGVKVHYSSDNKIYHNNFLYNTVQVESVSSINIWDNGYPSGGNYWSDYTGVDVKHGPNQDLIGNDGIGDTQYNINPQNVDHYPYCSMVPPIITITSPIDWALYTGGSATYSFSATATPKLASLTATITNLGGTPVPVNLGDTIPSSAGVYTLSVTATDIYGTSATKEVTFVVYDPNAGFVTGAGSIDSKAGDYKLDASLAGKAHFAFVSKYQKGATVPDGNTQFMFKTAGLDFSSSTYEWLVVAGSKAQFKGTGTINGEGNYKFMLFADDGGKTGVDAFRIRIWDAQTEAVVYDNGVNQPISSGNIIVHK
jgi:parallel beta-helix repeat protein